MNESEIVAEEAIPWQLAAVSCRSTSLVWHFRALGAVILLVYFR